MSFFKNIVAITGAKGLLFDKDSRHRSEFPVLQNFRHHKMWLFYSMFSAHSSVRWMFRQIFLGMPLICKFWNVFICRITGYTQKNPHLVLTFSDFFKLLFESNRWFAYKEILIWAVLSSSTVNFCLEFTFGMLFFNVWAI